MSTKPRVIHIVLAGLLAAVAVHSARADDAQEQYAVAAGHYAAQRWSLAVDEFQVFLDHHPNHPQSSSAAFFLGEALLQLQRYDKAQVYFQQCLRTTSEERLRRLAQFRIGEVAYLAGKPQQAKPGLQQFLEKHPQDELGGYALPYLGEIALVEGDLQAAGSFFQQALERFPEGPLQDDCRLGLGRVCEKQRRTDEAERYYLAISGKPDSPAAQEALFRLGSLQYASGRYAEALATLESLSARAPQGPRRATAILGCGWALVKLDRLAEAQRHLEQISGDPKVGIEARYWLGWIQKAQGRWDAAADTLLKTAAEAPGHRLMAAIRFQAGDALLRGGKPAAAIEQFEQVLAAADAGGEWLDDALRGRVQAALSANDHAAVDRYAAEFEKRAPESPLKPDVQRLLAQSLLERKEYGRAREMLEPFVAAADGQHALECRYLLALAYEGLKQYEDALAALTPVVTSAQGRLKADAQQAQASVLLAAKRFSEAVVPLESLLATKPDGDLAVRVHGQLAVCYARTARTDKAKSLYAEMIAKHPGHALVTPTTEQLAEAALDAGDKTWAEELFRRLAADEQAPGVRIKGLSGLAWTQFKSGQLQEAADTFDRLLQKDPDPALAAEAALVRGQILQRLNRSDGALAMFDLVIDKYSKTDRYGEALWAAARLRDDLDQDRQAVDLYQRLLEAFPTSPNMDAILYRQAWALADLGEAERSLAVFRRLRRDCPHSRYWPDVTFRLAQRAFEVKDYALADELAAAALGSKPDDAIRQHAMYLRGQIAAAGERWPEARKAFEALVATYPESSLRLLAEYGVAEAVFRQGDYAEASRRLEELAQRTENRQEVWLAVVPLRLAQALCHQKRWEEAHAIASKIGEKYPGFEQQFEVDYILGRCLANRADFAEAREAYLRVIRSPLGAKTETAAKAQLMIAESYFHQKNYEAALREFFRLEILYAYPALQAAAVMQAAKCYELLGKPGEAVKLYERLLNVYPKSEFVADATARLQSLKPRTARRAS